MWSITELDVVHLGRTPGGYQFVNLADSLIYAQTAICGVPYSSVHTNLRTDIPDGGVDTKVDVDCPAEPTGWLRTKSIWQFKATKEGSISDADLRKEVTKPYATECIRQGFAYRFCICDSITAETEEAWATKLTTYIREMKPDAPPAIVLGAGSIANWANHFPALILRIFRPAMKGMGIHLEAWRANAQDATPTYVSVPAWDGILRGITAHVDVSLIPATSVLPVQGVAGVGKTRLAYEALAAVPNLSSFAIYTNDEKQAIELATHLANDPGLTAVLVADECPLATRVRLEALTNGHRRRLRLIVIDNTGDRPPSKGTEYWLEIIPDDVLKEILATNFPHVPDERRRAYATLSGGYVRLAADLCTNDGVIAAAGTVTTSASNIRSYFRSRLPNGVLAVVEALALLSRVGVQNDVADELEQLCRLVGLDVSRVREALQRIHDAPGFVAWAGRYVYVTPEIIAQIAFEGGWGRWVAGDPDGFLRQLPESLLEPFMARISKSASPEVRRIVGDFFRRWAWSLKPGQLAEIDEVERLVGLVDIEPTTYLPVLRNLIEGSTIDELLAVIGEGIGRWGPRREIVWLAERVAAFPEYFESAEAILLRLAVAESEPKIGNNATAIWTQLYRIVLSGTAVPFQTRLKKLSTYIYSDTDRVSELALNALENAISGHAMRMMGPPIVAGRIPPAEWHPKTNRELRECWTLMIELLGQLFLSDRMPLRQRAQDIAVGSMRTLLGAGYLSELKAMFNNIGLTPDVRAQVIMAVEEFIQYDVSATSDRSRVSPQYASEVQAWLQQLKPTQFHDKLVYIVGADPWHYSIVGGEEIWQGEIRSLAEQFTHNHGTLLEELPWLHSANAKSSVVLGQAIGRLDEGGLLLELILEASVQFRSSSLARGYISGLVETHPRYGEQLNALIDKVQKQDPKLAYDLFIAGGEVTDPLRRALELVDKGQLSPAYLHDFFRGVGTRELSVHEIEDILQRLVDAAEGGDVAAARSAISFVSLGLTRDKKRQAQSHLTNLPIQQLVWRLIEVSVGLGEHTEGFWWGEILEELTSYDPSRAARIAASALISDALSYRDYAMKVLGGAIADYPEIVMLHLGEAMLDKERGWRFYVDRFADLIRSIPTAVVINWLQMQDVEAARRIARHLPIPYLKPGGTPVVPSITEYVLEKYESEDDVFTEFLAGAHSFQMYSGDIAAQHEREAEVARHFLTHRLRRVREWADYEIRNATHQAERWRQDDEERKISS